MKVYAREVRMPATDNDETSNLSWIIEEVMTQETERQ